MENMNATTKYITEMMKMQDELNTYTNGENWKSGVTKDNREIHWLRYLRQEVAEFIESFPYKHWKDLNVEPDYKNAKMEIVDIWHFLLSELLVRESSDSSDRIAKLNSEAIANTIQQAWGDWLAVRKEINLFMSERDRIDSILELADSVVKSSFETDITYLVYNISRLQYLLGMDITDIYNLYMIKNYLNAFRQSHGYKSGDYVKKFEMIDMNSEVITMEDNDLIVYLIEREGSLEKAIMAFEDIYENKISKYITGRL